MSKSAALAYLLLLSPLAACGGTVAYSEPVSIKVGKIGDGDVKNGTFDFDKEISTESGNPYKKFVDAARVELDGADPSAILIEEIVLTVASDSKGIGTTGFAEVMDTVEVYLTKGDTTVVVGGIETIASSTTMALDVTATEERLRVLHSDMVKGDFKVGVRGDALAMLPASFELRVNVQVVFRAIE